MSIIAAIQGMVQVRANRRQRAKESSLAVSHTNLQIPPLSTIFPAHHGHSVVDSKDLTWSLLWVELCLVKVHHVGDQITHTSECDLI